MYPGITPQAVKKFIIQDLGLFQGADAQPQKIDAVIKQARNHSSKKSILAKQIMRHHYIDILSMVAIMLEPGDLDESHLKTFRPP